MISEVLCTQRLSCYLRVGLKMVETPLFMDVYGPTGEGIPYDSLPK